jgi:hypothetical protein
MGINSQTGAYSAEAQAQRAAEAAAMAAQTANAAEVAARAVAEKTEALQADDSYDRLADNAAFSPISATSSPVVGSPIAPYATYDSAVAAKDYGKSSWGKTGDEGQDIGTVAPDVDGGGGGGDGPAVGYDGGDPGGSGARANGGMIGHYAQGGLGSLGGYSDGGRLLRGPGDGVSDSIPASIGNRQPARLADGEFVVPARIVSELGNGSTEAGARALYKMMARIQANRRKTTGRNRVAVDSKSHKYLPA